MANIHFHPFGHGDFLCLKAPSMPHSGDEEIKLRQTEPAWFAGGFNVVGGRNADDMCWLTVRRQLFLDLNLR